MEHPLHTLAVTSAFGFTKNRLITNFRRFLIKTTIYYTGQFAIDSGALSKIFWEEMKKPKGAPRPIYYKGSQLQKATQMGKSWLRKQATKPIASAGTRLLPIARFLFLTPFRTYLTLGTAYTAVGFAVGRTHVVRTAPPTNTQFVMGAPM